MRLLRKITYGEFSEFIQEKKYICSVQKNLIKHWFSLKINQCNFPKLHLFGHFKALWDKEQYNFPNCLIVQGTQHLIRELFFQIMIVKKFICMYTTIGRVCKKVLSIVLCGIKTTA